LLFVLKDSLDNNMKLVSTLCFLLIARIRAHDVGDPSGLSLRGADSVDDDRDPQSQGRELKGNKGGDQWFSQEQYQFQSEGMQDGQGKEGKKGKKDGDQGFSQDQFQSEGIQDGQGKKGKKGKKDGDQGFSQEQDQFQSEGMQDGQGGGRGEGKKKKRGKGKKKEKRVKMNKSGEDACALNQCDSQATCKVNHKGRAMCICPDGIEMRPGKSCLADTPCQNNPCDLLGTEVTCSVKEDGSPICLCPYGEPAIPGVPCEELEAEDGQEFESGDEGCDPQAMGCGSGASCVIHKDAPVCICPGKGKVAHNVNCVDEESNGRALVLIEEEAPEEEATEDSSHRSLAETCEDNVGWKDSYGDGCWWYEWYDWVGCPHYGHMFDDGMGTPQQACCHCGGGNIVPSDDPFTIIFIADMEAGYRHHQDSFCSDIVTYIKDIKNKGFRYDDPLYSSYEINPEMVIHGGDISDSVDGIWKDSWYDMFRGEPEDYIMEHIFQQLYDAGIPFLSSSGNHDYLPGTETPIAAAKKFVSKSFEKTKALKPDDFSYTRHQADSLDESDYYTASYKGLQIATVDVGLTNEDDERGGFISGAQWTEFQSQLDKSKPTFFFSHFPELRQKIDSKRHLGEFIDDFPAGTAHFSGDTHRVNKEGKINSGSLRDYTAPYPHPWDGLSPGFFAVLVSPADGILDVKEINYDYQEVTGCWGAGTTCAEGTSCKKCCPDQQAEWWHKDLFWACGKEPCWGNGYACGAGTTCNQCCNSWSWWTGLGFTMCGVEPCWGGGTVCGSGTTCNSCCSGGNCPWWGFGICTCN
jgi:hypothetical protein